MKSKRCSHNLQSNHQGNSQQFYKMLMSRLNNLCRFPGHKKTALDPVRLTPTKTPHGEVNFSESITTVLYGAPNQSIFPTYFHGLLHFLYGQLAFLYGQLDFFLWSTEHFLYGQLDFLYGQLDFLYGQLNTFYMVNSTFYMVN